MRGPTFPEVLGFLTRLTFKSSFNFLIFPKLNSFLYYISGVVSAYWSWERKWACRFFLALEASGH